MGIMVPEIVPQQLLSGVERMKLSSPPQETRELTSARETRGVPRVAFLADSFHEVNGAARTCREFAAFAKRNRCPFFSVRFAKRESVTYDGPYWTMELRRSPLSIGVDPDLRFDLTFLHLCDVLEKRLREFAPDVIHVMAPAELGILGAIAAWRLRIPLVAAWHTNLHEYAARRLPLGSSRIRDRV